uniref:Apolipophorin-3 n=1 Tax=Cacopsylla melanoneura TaxID=428564 RepID=A0A8D8XM10_9HEMI
MKFAVVALLVVLQVWTASAAPRAKAGAPAAATTPSSLPSFEEFVAQAQANIKTVSEHLNEMVGLPKNADASDLFNIVKNNTDTYTKELSELVEKIKKQVDSAKTGEVSETVKAIQEKLEKTVASLKKEIDSPEVQAKTKQIQENFTKSLNVIVDEAGKLSKTVTTDKALSEDLQKLSKQVVDQAVKAADTIQQSVHEATGHKHESTTH